MAVGLWAEQDFEQRARLLTALYVAEQQFGYLSPEAIQRVAERLQMSEGEVMRTASFYSMYRTQSTGRYLLQVCEGLACHLAGGADDLLAYLQERLGISIGETTPDGLFTLVSVPCLAACDVSPAMRVNDTLHTQLTEDLVDQILAELRGE
jgi:NADH-quinone oxidoreductase subunit E